MDNDKVLYIQCPHCKKGWYAPVLDIQTETVDGEVIVTHCYVQGLAVTDLRTELTCLNCGGKYTAVTSEGTSSPGMTMMFMWDWVARLLTTCRGK